MSSPPPALEPTPEGAREEQVHLIQAAIQQLENLLQPGIRGLPKLRLADMWTNHSSRKECAQPMRR